MKISIVTTLYYSEKFIQDFYTRIKETVQTITQDYEIIFVNDGSPDKSLQRVIELQMQDPKIVVVDLSRNFGHHRAIMTGLREAQGDYIFLIDSDLEESPELLTLYWTQFEVDKDCDVVYGIQDKRKGRFMERISGRVWYSLFSFLSDIDYPTDSLTARLMSRRYINSVILYAEKELEIWGIFVLAGFNQKAIKVSKGNKGSSTYTLRRKLKMMVDSVTSFSSKPLIYIFILGLLITFFSAIYISYLVIMRLIYNEAAEGWTSTLVSIWFIGGLLIFCIGIIGIYLSKMFLEIKNRPLSIVRKIYKKDN
jgi:putative glycosyltransferase